MYTETANNTSNLQAKSSARELKKRLDWGEPALTIVDTRDRQAFNTSHIMGAISLVDSELVARATKNLEKTRDIYVYNSTDEKTTESAELLRQEGYTNVSELTGGLAAWKALGYPIEGNAGVVS